MKITLGKWKTRDGRKAIAAAVNEVARESQRVIGWVGEFSQCWCTDGRWSSNGGESELDLIAPWTDPVPWDWSTTPPWFDCIIQGPSGNWYLCESIVRAGNDGIMFNGSRSIPIPPEYAPKWSGDWKLSKTMRPKEVAK